MLHAVILHIRPMLHILYSTTHVHTDFHADMMHRCNICVSVRSAAANNAAAHYIYHKSSELTITDRVCFC